MGNKRTEEHYMANKTITFILDFVKYADFESELCQCDMHVHAKITWKKYEFILLPSIPKIAGQTELTSLG